LPKKAAKVYYIWSFLGVQLSKYRFVNSDAFS